YLPAYRLPSSHVTGSISLISGCLHGMKIQEITSSANEKIKYLKKLSHKKDRDESRQFVVENLLIIHDAMQAGSYPASIYLTRQIYDSGSDKIRYLLNRMQEVYLV